MSYHMQSIHLVIIDLVGIVGNVLIVLGILSNKHLRNTITNILIVNLAATDLLLIATSQPFDILSDYFHSRPLYELPCRAFYYLSSVFIYTVAYTLVLMNVDRILAILFPDTSKTVRTLRNTCIAILGLWVLVLLCCIPFLYHMELVNISDTDVLCIFSEGYEDVAISVFVTSFVLPMITFVSLFVVITVKPRPANEAPDGCPEIHISYLVVALDLVFLFCWGRFQAYILYETFPTNLIYQPGFQVIAKMITTWSHARACINPIIFFIMSKKFPGTFKNVTYCHCLSRKSEEVKYSDMIPLSANVSDDDVN